MPSAEESSSSRVQLLGPPQVRELAEQLDVSPTKKLGQNFVHDPNTVRKIVAAAEVGPADHVVEVGPGLGSLTLALMDVVQGVTAVEIDARLAHQLPLTCADRAPAVADTLSVLHQDALAVTKADFEAADQPMPTALVANLPYNVSVPVLLHLLDEFPTIHRVLVMVQLEVADRLAASPGSKIYGVPSVKAGFYGSVTRAATIGKNVFWPAPKIDSGLVRMDRFDPQDAPWDVDDQQLKKTVFALADAAFLQRRKTLRAALSSYFGGAQVAEDMLVAAGIDPKERGEKLSTADFVRLAQAVIAKESAAGSVDGSGDRSAAGSGGKERTR
ncbi:16S rRNA (adenine(1518)-N(6)/adenine(1519)-N(6))-dimethyltransferase RsmA [Corynebacterium sp. 319]|uniref:16S rRNA (adenine(1518)-N(6)/adenine(1519)-N(6))- dimethyltransferase RsmA n=1 Tax=unclassified Corynebacterium TaxID=2624378 RepID=UPI00125CB15D|nr:MULTISPECIES: 16S rRNA (adenine(1518)-N(6)/adenine(1519)-N(6))-dimethyltransferase RsmA [unclassified Corynebacterium]KAB1552815.1 16S rRNA (adenine(1518)-N(6)/adenine(1519)-N(6))-dimethyltransferase RsmA [Corynebacterium sp. 321]KAB1553967.1 16S rRNA (adenine(1518)-N(6)/adenine(1519)-N(6))-dimethyltransferase RsmA [Corynebacterium sp. 319]KAB3540290.1 16S rRNA (adenine(1518)-N(6)/adenine(1519)-N(6))-dimethyltransferase RsmA [Corynebacterium sp. 366]